MYHDRCVEVRWQLSWVDSSSWGQWVAQVISSAQQVPFSFEHQPENEVLIKFDGSKKGD